MISRAKPERFKEKFEVVSCFIEHDSKILLLHRQDYKPQGDTWGVPAGKVDKGETLPDAIIREIKEEIELTIKPHELVFFDTFYVRYPEYDFIYHVFHTKLDKIPKLNLNPIEHKDYVWTTPSESLKMNLIPDEDFCIKAFYNV